MPDNAAVQEALERIVASAGFVNSPRMSRFLRFVVEETAAGRAAGLKEYVVGLRVFDKAESFDPTVDPTVRVEASKLRAKLARYYETEGRGDSTIIEIPKGHYGARFCVRADSEQYRSSAVEAAPTSRATGRGAVTVFDQPPAETNEPRAAARPPVRRRAALALGVAALVTLGSYAAPHSRTGFIHRRVFGPGQRRLSCVLAKSSNSRTKQASPKQRGSKLRTLHASSSLSAISPREGHGN